MPKLVDPEARRQLVVDAVFRVAIRDGLQHASLRHVADEAGLNIGSVRHYFASHRQLLLFAMQAMLDRVSDRLERRIENVHPASLSSAERHALATDVLEELLPVDERRRAEVTVWIEFMTAARTDPALGELARYAADGSKKLVHRILDRAMAAGTLRADLDLDVEATRLVALVDGLSFGAVVSASLTPDTVTAVLDAHLTSLTA